jgi:hypothetical protein
MFFPALLTHSYQKWARMTTTICSERKVEVEAKVKVQMEQSLGRRKNEL